MRAIGPPLSDEERAAFIAAARSCMGVPFRHQGRSMFGLDCVGLGIFAMHAIGRPFLDVQGYGRQPGRQGLRAALVANLGDPLAPSQMQIGDIALMTFSHEPSHVGIIVDNPDRPFGVIHTFAQAQKVVEHGIDAQWMSYITEVFRP